MVLTLTNIEEMASQKPNVRVKARGFKEALLKYETILTAQTFLYVFEKTSPLSKYLQTSGLDILTAHRMVVETQEALQKNARDFDSVKRAADIFVQWATAKLQEQDEDTELEVQTELPKKRIRKRKTMPGELAQDEVERDVEMSYKTKVHHIIMDTVTESIHQYFLTHGTLFADLAYLDPRRFSEIRDNGLPKTSLTELSRCLLKFDNRATVVTLQYELTSLAGQWEKLKKSAVEEYTTRIVRAIPMDGTDEEHIEIMNKSCSTCKNCAVCCYQLLQRYNLLTDAYHVIGFGYKFLLTLSVTQLLVREASPHSNL